jgi:hypothetical protein
MLNLCVLSAGVDSERHHEGVVIDFYCRQRRTCHGRYAIWFHTFLERRIEVLTSRIEVRGFLFLDVRSDSPNIPNALFLFVS